MQYQDYYETLGVDKDADADVIKKAYRKLARKYHPDVSKAVDAEEKFKALGEAYEVLKDPDKRAAYDQLGHNWQAGQDFQAPPEWDAHFQSNGFGQGDAGFDNFSDFFSSLFGADTQGHHGPPPARDSHARINLTLEELYAQAPVELFLRDARSGEDKRLRVKVPPQMRDGQSFRLRGQGTPGRAGGEAGDLYVEVCMVPHPKFSVQGDDVYSELLITPWEAVLGAQVPVETLGGTVNLKIPPRSTQGRQLRLQNRGMPGAKPGHHFVSLRIQVPDNPTDKELEQYAALAETSAFDPRQS